MADNSFNSFPTPPRNPAEIITKGTEGSANKAQIEIIRIPANLQNQGDSSQQHQRTEGLVTQSDPKTNRVIIRTPEGEIELQLPKQQSLPPRGTSVEIRLPPQNAKNQTVTLQILPPPPAKTDQIQVNAQKQPSDPVQVKPYQSPQTPAASGQTASQPPQVQSAQPVRVVPLPPNQLPDIQVIPLPPTLSVRLLPPSPPHLPVTLPQQPQTTQSLTLSLSVSPPSTSPPTQTQSATSLGSLPPTLPSAIPLSITVSPATQPTATVTTMSPEIAIQTAIAPIQNVPVSALPQITPLQLLQALPLPSPTESVTFPTPVSQAIGKLTIPASVIQIIQAAPTPPPLTISNTSLQSPLPQAPLSFPKQAVNTAPLQVTFTAPVFEPQQVQTLTQVLQQQPPAFLQPQATPAHLPATVIGFTPQHQPVISLQPYPASSAPQFFTLQNVSAPLGTGFALQVAALNTPLTNALPLSNAQNTLLPPRAEQLFQTQNWPVLNDILDVLQQANPALAQQITQMIPSAATPARIPPALMLFLAVVRGGDLSTWIGERPAEMLQRLGRGDLLTRLNTDGTTLNRASAESLPNEWRGMIFPFHSGQELQNIVLYYKQDGGAKNDGEQKKQTRFIFDLDLSRMGSVQIDGLFKPVEGEKRLDLVLRTEAPLSEAMKQEMRQSYAKVLRYGDVTGELTFQGEKASFVKILTQKENVKFTT